MSESRKHLLIVDDERALREAIAERLTDHDFDVEQVSTGEEALQRLSDFAFDVLITDLRLPGIDGRQVLDAALERYPDIIAIVITGFGTVKDAVDAIKQGAADFITKPFQFDALLHVLSSAVEQRRLRAENAYLRSQLEQRYRIDGVIGQSSVMRSLAQLLETVAATSSTVLITGETGTGKELVARAIHARSAQRNMPLIKVNCAAIPETLLESELFGHVRGAFTGAATSKKGKFALADGGTILLDEIGTMSPVLQSKLLRVLQEREFEPLGSERSQQVDVRVIASTNRDLRQMVLDGTFQEDLFYRLNVIPIEMPPLRNRREDIPVLAEHFVRKHQQRTGKRIDRIEDGVHEKLAAYEWPGNVRELENTIERAVVLSTSAVISTDAISVLGVAAGQSNALPSLKLRTNIEWIEQETIRRALDSAGGVKKDAADLMGISQRALSYYLAKYKLS